MNGQDGWHLKNEGRIHFLHYKGIIIKVKSIASPFVARARAPHFMRIECSQHHVFRPPSQIIAHVLIVVVCSTDNFYLHTG